MIPVEKVKKIIDRYDLLEKELSSGKFDSKLFSCLSANFELFSQRMIMPQ